jgi:hypothetical protein
MMAHSLITQLKRRGGILAINDPARISVGEAR